MCFESKTRVSALVPCVLELHLKLRRFISMGKCWNTKYRESALLLCRTYATIAYVRDNAVCRMKYAVREYASSLITIDVPLTFNVLSACSIYFLANLLQLIYITVHTHYALQFLIDCAYSSFSIGALEIFLATILATPLFFCYEITHFLLHSK